MTAPIREEAVGRVRREGARTTLVLFGTRGDAVPAPELDDLPEGTVVRRFRQGEASQRQVLATPGSGLARIWGLVERHHLRVAWPDAAWAEVAALSTAPGIDDPSLVDLEALPFCTIDNSDSRDLDQALHLARAPGGGHVARYALADAAHYVQAQGALFTEGTLRGASFYLPGLSVPMLPRALSEGLVSLNPDVPRRAVVFTMELDAEGRVTGVRVERARIRSRAKLSYDGVQRFYDDPAAHPLPAAELRESLELLRVVGGQRQALARLRDVVDYERIGADVALAPGGGPGLELVTDSRLEVERHNEQLSLMCNIEGAKLLARAMGPRARLLQAVYRVHEAPPPERLAELAESIEAIITAHGLDRERFAWRRASDGDHEPLSDYLTRLPRDAEHARLRAALERQVRLTNVRSLFAATPGQHYALGVEGYARFSAPMREIAGIFTHKEALELLGLAPPDQDTAADAALREAVIEAANRSKEVQSQLTKDAYKLAIDDLLAGDLAPEADERPLRVGTVLGATPTKLYVRLDEPPIELKVYAEDLARAWQTTTRPLPGASGIAAADGSARFVAGDAIGLRASELDPQRDRWHFDVV